MSQQQNSIDTLPDAIDGILGELTADVVEGVNEAIEDASKAALKTVRKTAPRRAHYPDGVTPEAYAKSWRRKVEKHPRGNSAVVYSERLYPLTHLLENGHMNRDGSRTEGIPHISTARDQAAEVLVQRLPARIEEAIK